MEWLYDIFRENQVIPIFLTLGLGFWIGNLKIKSFSLGPVTATLIVGVIIGQIGFDISPTVKSLAFMLFLFSIGYSVGPQFFHSLKGDGLKQICFALVECVIVVAVTLGVCKLMGYNKGMTVGIFAGAQTVSAVLGLGGDTIRSLGLSPEETNRLIGYIPVCYAVCYVFGTVGTAWIVGNLGPILLGGKKKVIEETMALENAMEEKDFVPQTGQFVANRRISFRAYKAESDFFDRPRTISEIERHIKGKNIRHFIERVRVKGEIMEPDPNLRIRKGDVIVLSGRRESIIKHAGWVGPEVTDHELLSFGSENLPVTVSKSGASGLTLGELRMKPFMDGVMVNKLLRNNIPVHLGKSVRLEAGDVLSLVGQSEHVANAVPEIGYSDRQGYESDIVFIGLGIALGCFIGAIEFHLGSLPISLSTSGGAIISGLVLGWLRSKHPTYGHIPRSVNWFMDNAGLNLFIAIVGLSAGPTFVSGLHEVGLQVFFVGAVCTTIPLIISIYVANKVFRIPAAVALGCVAGSRNAVAALGGIQDNLDSTLPMMGYTVTYAVGSVVMILSGLVVSILA